MANISKLPYGESNLNFKLPDHVDSQTIKPVLKKPPVNYEKKIKAKLRNPTGTLPLKDICKKGEEVVIIVSDITRLAYNTKNFLPIIVEELNQAGIEDKYITIVVATGMHRQQTPEEDKMVVGEEIYNRIEIENHDCQANNLINLGESSRGTEISINRTVYKADRLILTGGISYHLLAGFGGGPKSIAPGVCGYDSIQQNHSLVVRNTGDNGINPEVKKGILKDNPVSEDLFEIAEKINPDFIVNVIVNENKEYLDIVAGDLRKAFLEGCQTVEKIFGTNLKRKSDLVIGSCGGYPKDIQLYQSIKGLDNTGYAVKEGGVIILCSECSDGPGSEKFMKWFEHNNLKEMKKELKHNFSMPGFVAVRTANILSKAKVILISSLPEEVVEKVGMIPAQSPGEAVKKAKNYLNKINSVNIMPQAAVTFPITE